MDSSADELSSRDGSLKEFDHRSSPSGSLKADKSTIQFKEDNQKLHDASLKVPHKIIANWRQACDRTKDKTKDLLKRWRTLPEFEADQTLNKVNKFNGKPEEAHQESCGWSVHVWTTWVDRFSIDSSDLQVDKNSCVLTTVQNCKFAHFFTCLLDHDQDDLISSQDFETLIERLRHFADWSINSSEFNILREVERGFIDTFLHDISDDKLGFQVNEVSYLTKEGWLSKWSLLLAGSRNLGDFPIWLQFFVKVLFQVINRSGTGIITRDELSCFYSSVLGLDAVKVGEILDLAYQAMTSNGDHPLLYRAYRLCFANFLLGRYPHGPGQYILGAPPNSSAAAMFPVDYSALNSSPEDLEQYAPDQKTNRRSVVV